MIDKWCGLAFGVIFAVVFVASANRVAETMSDGWTIESIDQDFITSAQLAWRFRFVGRAIAVFSAIGFVGAMLIVCYGAPGWRVLSLLLAVSAVLIVPRTEVSMERAAIVGMRRVRRSVLSTRRSNA